MDKEIRPNADFSPWGPFIGSNFKNQPITLTDAIIASVVSFITLIFAGFALYQLFVQMKSSRSPLRSTYIWLIWLEFMACFLMGVVAYLHLWKIIRPSFALYLSLVLEWCIQVQMLLQIIINRIRVIVPDRRHSKRIMIGVAAIVTVINISVCCLWTPARLQVSTRIIRINEIWDRIEKVLYLLIDAALNWYFLRVVKANLINNGLQKYNRLLRFNQRIIVVSLLMDVMIIAAMSIPNGFVYVTFHPLAYLVKLNIEMLMANLIKRIAISTSKRTGKVSMVDEFVSDNKSTSNHTSNHASHHVSNHNPLRRNSIIELSSHSFSRKHEPNRDGKNVTFMPMGNQIKKTEEIFIQSEPNPHWLGKETDPRLKVGEQIVPDSKSLDDLTESGGSMKSEEIRGRGDSDDEAILVTKGRGRWGRLP